MVLVMLLVFSFSLFRLFNRVDDDSGNCLGELSGEREREKENCLSACLTAKNCCFYFCSNVSIF